MKKKKLTQEQLNKFFEIPMIILAILVLILFIIDYTVPLYDPWETLVGWLKWIIWSVFVIEYASKLYIANEKWKYIISNWFALLVILLPFLRIFRVFRAFRAIKVFRGVKAFGITKIMQSIGEFKGVNIYKAFDKMKIGRIIIKLTKKIKS
ncbi:hypothetical protein ACFLZ2_05480 [Candidatus Margulisiibacteriota bacterium]